MKESIRRIYILIKRNFKEIIRDYLSLIFLFLLPIVMLVTFYLLFHKATSQFSVAILAPGIVAFSNAFNCLFMGILIATDRSSAFLTRLYTTPIKSYEFVLGYSFVMIPIALLQSILIYLVAIVMEPAFFNFSLILSILGNIPVAFLFIGFGVLFGTLCNEKSVGGISTIIIMGQSILSGMWFTLDTLSKGFNNFIKCLPFRNSSLLLQNLCDISKINNFLTNIGLPLLIVLLYAIIIYSVAVILYNKKMKNK